MITKKEDHNTGVRDGIKKFLVDNLIKNLKQCLIKEPNSDHKKVLYQKAKNRCVIMSTKSSLSKKFLIKNPHQESKKWCLNKEP